MASVQIIDGGRRVRVALPELAAAEFDGGGIGQAAMFGSGPPPNESVEAYEAWCASTTRKVGKGAQRVVECGDETLDELQAAFEALAISCSQGELPSEAAACRIAFERVSEARRMLAAVTS